MQELEKYGRYYKVFKGNGGIPEKVTVIKIDGDTVTFIRGHHTKADFAERGSSVNEAIKNMCLTKMKCSIDKILPTITPKQKQIIDREERKFQRMIEEADKALEEFKNGL